MSATIIPAGNVQVVQMVPQQQQIIPVQMVPVQMVPVQMVQGKGGTGVFDPHTENVLANANRLRLVQRRAFLEGFTGGAYPNLCKLCSTLFIVCFLLIKLATSNALFLFLRCKDSVCDWNQLHQQVRNGQPYGQPIPKPIFIIEEESGACCSGDWWCRVCCSPNHPILLKIYHATALQPQDPQKCCCITCGQRPDISYPDKNRGAILSLERFGLCQRFAGCWVCCECCQDEMRIHRGDVGQAGDAGSLPEGTMLGRGIVPIGGGGCTPTVNIMDRSAGVPEKQAAVIEGPMCFGGILDCCCDTSFKISRTKGKSGDLGRIIKKIPEGCSGWCRAACTTADTYDIELTEAGAQTMTPFEKAAVISEAIHLDYMFFEKDQFPISCEQRGNTTYLTLTACLCYCYGCLCPIQLTVPLNSDS